MNYLANVSRNPGDPRILQTGPSSVGAADRLAKALGWFGLGLGLVQLMAPRRVTRALGIEGHERLVRTFGIREVGSGVLSLSVDKNVGLWSRLAGDGLDLATLSVAARRSNPKRGNVETAMMMVLGVALLDLAAALGTGYRHARETGAKRVYSDRSGFPQGVEKARGAARDFKDTSGLRGPPRVARVAQSSPA